MRKFSKARALKLKLDDRCSRCGRKAGRKNGSTCNTCLDYQRDWRRKKYGVLPENYRKKTAR
jgi:ribosomal protein L37E